MTEREEFIAEMRVALGVMGENREAYHKYIEARDAGSTLFSDYVNKHGWRAAKHAKEEAEK